jgi:ABC-2 type transport system ATP-binding protein
MLEINGLTKAYGRLRVLRGVDLTVPPGRITGLVGANGAGKTTLISIATGLIRPDAGRVNIAGFDVLTDRRRAASRFGLAPQDLGVYPTLTVVQNLEFAARIGGVRSRAVRGRVDEVSGLLGLTELGASRASDLSGGQKRRLHTAMALIHRPAVLFLDEPTVGADVRARAGILDVVRAMAAQGTAVLYTTHYLAELEALGSDVAVLHEGRIAANGPLDEVAGGNLEAAYLAITGTTLNDKEGTNALAA